MKELVEVLVLKADLKPSKSEADSVVQSLMILHREALIQQGVWDAIEFQKINGNESAILPILPFEGPTNLHNRGKVNIPSEIFDGIRIRNNKKGPVTFVIQSISAIDKTQYIIIWSLVTEAC